jgi:hypothetical protein
LLGCGCVDRNGKGIVKKGGKEIKVQEDKEGEERIDFSCHL